MDSFTTTFFFECDTHTEFLSPEQYEKSMQILYELSAMTSEKVEENGEELLDVLNGYEKLRNVGKGAFGVAVLYRKACDNKLVVIKQVNMTELSATERQMALNEVQVLKILDHHNIISYYGSFEKNGMLYIEMEYADGGTLAQYLAQQTQPLKEKDILFMFRQVVSAIKYMHNFNILHRDLKTANIFLTKEKVIKVGDFGIAKIMTTFARAHSVLGTPHYISPEMCEGKDYDEKSDIWALGCLLYEMACLKKTFNGTNLPAVVNKIMKGAFQPVPLDYSTGLRQLIYDLLERNPQCRPSSAEIFDTRIPIILKDLIGSEVEEQPLLQGSVLSLRSNGKLERSVFYELVSFEAETSLIPLPLPSKLKIIEIAVSNTHFIALTAERMVFTWGEGKMGQLGQGDLVPWIGIPRPVELLADKKIKIIGAGDGFSVFGSESGMIMTCGDGSLGCLGHNNWDDIVQPKLLEALLSVDITAVSCGCQHVAAMSTKGIVYSWGMGKGGRLGLGHEENRCVPIPVPCESILKSVICGGDATMAIAVDGTLFACGNNSYNRLGLSGRKHRFSLSIQTVEKSLTLRRVNSISEKISDISLGVNHTAILTEEGRVITMGRNLEGQLGRHNTKPCPSPSVVKCIADNTITMTKCGITFSIVGTMENEIYFWGTRFKGYSNRDQIFSNGWSLQEGVNGSEVSITSSKSFLNNRKEIILEPKELLALYASSHQIDKRETLELAGIYTAGNRIFFLVDTTVPLTKNSRCMKINGTLNNN